MTTTRHLTYDGETGEIVTHGPMVFNGYWKRPEATEAAFVEIDGKRVGIFGTSYGGYASALALLRYPDQFAAASASSGTATATALRRRAPSSRRARPGCRSCRA